MTTVKSKNLFIIQAKELTKSFPLPDKNRLIILRELNLDIPEGKIICITGVSGSGKSTLLHLCGALDQPDSGEILFCGEPIGRFDSRRLATYRNLDIGFVFQFHYLMPELTVSENIMAPLLLKNYRLEEAKSKAAGLLDQVGLSERGTAMPHQLSGGEKQRAAIARALINGPRLLLADEPTGNLDWKTGKQVFDLFRRLIAELGLTAVIVSHNRQLAEMTDTVYSLQDGRLLRET